MAHGNIGNRRSFDGRFLRLIRVLDRMIRKVHSVEQRIADLPIGSARADAMHLCI